MEGSVWRFGSSGNRGDREGRGIGAIGRIMMNEWGRRSYGGTGRKNWQRTPNSHTIDFSSDNYNDLIPALRRNATLADDWLYYQAQAAAAFNISLQYCMPYPRDYLASAML